MAPGRFCGGTSRGLQEAFRHRRLTRCLGAARVAPNGNIQTVGRRANLRFRQGAGSASYWARRRPKATTADMVSAISSVVAAGGVCAGVGAAVICRHLFRYFSLWLHH